MAGSSDYASLSEHAITNFAGLIRGIGPGHLYLHNPPAHVEAQMHRFYSTAVQRYDYPAVTRKTLLQVRDDFARHLVGQAEVKEKLLTALYPLTTSRRATPIVLMLYGPSGVGKTETAQFVNGLLGGTLLRKQFSMFHNEKFASYLFGGTHSEPSFAHDLLDRESGVILIDEFDKANAVFHSAFYKLFDGGVFEDTEGQAGRQGLDYRVAVNGDGADLDLESLGAEQELQSRTRRVTHHLHIELPFREGIRQALGDALFSRFDSLIGFQPLTPDEIRQVIDRLVNDRFSKLEPDEQARLDASSLKRRLHERAGKIANVRQLGKFVDEVISLQLVRSLLIEESASEA